ncbi:MAG: VTT domain-containing protein [Patescibacteria group bacterium]
MFDLVALIKTAGYFGLFGIIFAESGLLIGFFFPGDSLLFTAGFLASQGFLDIWLLMGLTFIAAVLGDSAGYMFGEKIGPAIFSKEDSWFFNKNNVYKAEKFFKKHGSKTIVLARFLPVVRTFVPILAGVGTMPYRTFIVYNLIGGALWSLGLSLLGYFLGSLIPGVDRYLLPIIILIIVLSILPSAWHVWRERSKKIN